MLQASREFCSRIQCSKNVTLGPMIQPSLKTPLKTSNSETSHPTLETHSAISRSRGKDQKSLDKTQITHSINLTNHRLQPPPSQCQFIFRPSVKKGQKTIASPKISHHSETLEEKWSLWNLHLRSNPPRFPWRETNRTDTGMKEGEESYSEAEFVIEVAKSLEEKNVELRFARARWRDLARGC